MFRLFFRLFQNPFGGYDLIPYTPGEELSKGGLGIFIFLVMIVCGVMPFYYARESVVLPIICVIIGAFLSFGRFQSLMAASASLICWGWCMMDYCLVKTETWVAGNNYSGADIDLGVIICHFFMAIGGILLIVYLVSRLFIYGYIAGIIVLMEWFYAWTVMRDRENPMYYSYGIRVLGVMIIVAVVVDVILLIIGKYNLKTKDKENSNSTPALIKLLAFVIAFIPIIVSGIMRV